MSDQSSSVGSQGKHFVSPNSGTELKDMKIGLGQPTEEILNHLEQLKAALDKEGNPGAAQAVATLMGKVEEMVESGLGMNAIESVVAAELNQIAEQEGMGEESKQIAGELLNHLGPVAPPSPNEADFNDPFKKGSVV